MSADRQRDAVLWDLPPEGEVHLWLLPRDESLLDELAAVDRDLLSADERTRLQAFHAPLSARRFLLQRILLRRGLARYLGVEPGRLVFTLGPHGKPAVAHPPSPGLCFNLSHCGTAAVLAVAQGNRLGADLEARERAAAALRISKRFFSEHERLQLARYGDAAGSDALKLWVLKESIVKALGETVWDGLSSVGLSLDAAGIGWSAPPPEGDVTDWTLMLGELRGTHVFAVALNAAAAQRRPHAWRAYTLGRDRPADDEVELLLTSVPC